VLDNSALNRVMTAVRRADKGQWALADVLVAEVGKGRSASAVQSEADVFRQIAERAEEEGYQVYKAEYLRKLRDIAVAFPEGRRPGSITVAQEAGTLAVLRQAERIAAEDGVAVTKRQVRKVREAVHEQARRAQGQTARTPSGNRRPVSTAAAARHAAQPTSDLRRTADVLSLSVRAGKAADEGRRYVTELAGQSLTTDERDELLDDIDRVLATWKAARDATKNPLAKEAAEFLQGV
jgi:hypothetical protein